jgi:hypothetical protein
MYSSGSRYGGQSPRSESEDCEIHSELQVSSAHSDAGSIRWRDFTGPGNRIRVTSDPDGSQTISIYLAPGVWNPERWHTLRAGQRPPEPTESDEEGNANLQPGAVVELGGNQAARDGQGGESAQ